MGKMWILKVTDEKDIGVLKDNELKSMYEDDDDMYLILMNASSSSQVPGFT